MRLGLGRKVKRVSDVNAMGYTPYDPTAQMQNNVYPNLGIESPAQNPYNAQSKARRFVVFQYLSLASFVAAYSNQPYNPNQDFVSPQSNPQMYNFNPGPGPQFNNVPQPGNPQFGVFGQPIIQDMALQYGQQVQ